MACKHDYQLCHTPPDSARKWYRCQLCGVFASKKRRNQFTPFRCTALNGTLKCSRPAIDRLPGRGPRASYLWVCETHDPKGNHAHTQDDQPPDEPAADAVADG